MSPHLDVTIYATFQILRTYFLLLGANQANYGYHFKIKRCTNVKSVELSAKSLKEGPNQESGASWRDQTRIKSLLDHLESDFNIESGISLVHLGITDIFDVLDQANAIISFNNKPASDAVPFFEQVVVTDILFGVTELSYADLST